MVLFSVLRPRILDYSTWKTKAKTFAGSYLEYDTRHSIVVRHRKKCNRVVSFVVIFLLEANSCAHC